MTLRKDLSPKGRGEAARMPLILRDAPLRGAPQDEVQVKPTRQRRRDFKAALPQRIRDGLDRQEKSS